MDSKFKDFDWASIGFDFGNWEEELVWALDIPAQELDINLLTWHLAIPYWTNDQGVRWTVSPQDVIDGETGTREELKRTDAVDLFYPIDLYEHNGRLFVLDGLHRLVKQYMEGEKSVTVRIVPKEHFPDIASEHPFELPS
jgi:hypothetical protein